MKSIIVAMDQNRGIGAENDLLWLRDLPDDLAHFKKVTTGGTVVMGRKTFDSIKKPLVDRQNIAITRSPDAIASDNVAVASSLEEAYQMAKHDIFIIGGGQIYKQAFDDAERLYVTEVQASFPQASVFFPEIRSSEWQEIYRVSNKADERNKYDFDFVIYERY